MKHLTHLCNISFLGLILIISLGCILSETTPTPGLTPIPPTQSPPPQVTTPAVTATLPVPTTPAVTCQAIVNVASINLRDGPGTTFAMLSKAAQGTLLTILGKAPGNDWVLAQTPGGQAGWAAVDFMSLLCKMENIPLKNIDFAYVIKGKVTESNGSPVDGIDIAVFQVDNGRELRTDAITTASGEFYAYLPASSKGGWSVGMVGIKCTSRIMQTECKIKGRFVPPKTLVTLPDIPDSILVTYLP